MASLRFVDATGSIVSVDLYLNPAGNGKCNICEYAINGECYRSVGGEYINICGRCVVTYVRPISNNQLDVAPAFMNQFVYMNVDANVYNGMRQNLCSDLRGVGVKCSICKHSNRGVRWAYVNTYNNSVYACHIRCVVQTMGNNQSDAHLNYEINPFWILVGRISLVAFQQLANQVAPLAPFNSALSIILRLRAYQVHRARY